MSEREGDSLLPFLLGGLVGAGLALLLAPTTGEETRKRVREWLKDAEKKGERFLKEQGKLLAEKGRDALEGREHRRRGAGGEDA